MNFPEYVKHERIKKWVQEQVELCKPDNVYWCDGSTEEYDEMWRIMVESGSAIKPKKTLVPPTTGWTRKK